MIDIFIGDVINKSHLVARHFWFSHDAFKQMKMREKWDTNEQKNIFGWFVFNSVLMVGFFFAFKLWQTHAFSIFYYILVN